MKTLKVDEKLSKAQRLMKGRRFRVLKEIDEEIDQEVKFKDKKLLCFSKKISILSAHKIKKIVLHPCERMHLGL